MSAVDQAELQRIAQQVELNRQRMESIEQQMKRLEQILSLIHISEPTRPY